MHWANGDDLIGGLRRIRRFDAIRAVQDDLIECQDVSISDLDEANIQKEDIEGLNQKLVLLFEKLGVNSSTT